MSRIESQALGGFYETQPDILPLIAAQIGCPADTHHTITFLDPCAGKGAAILDIAYRLTNDGKKARFAVYAAEAEQKRADELSRAIKASNANHRSTTLEGDAFQAVWTYDTWNDGADLLFLNPPYDHDRDEKRLEEKFLKRFTDALRPGGILVFLVPFHALKHSAETLATHYHSIGCCRYPEPEWNEFHQVVLFAIRSDVPDYNQVTQQIIEKWAEHPAELPILQETDQRPYVLQLDGSSGFASFELSTMDMETALAQAPVGISQRWMGLDRDPDQLIGVTFPVAEPARPVHIAMSIASGAISGQQVTSGTPGLPDLMVNGSFERETVTVDTNTNSKGEVTGYVQIEQPKLRVSVLDMETWTYYDLAAGAEPTGTTDIAEFNIADLLYHYQDSLADALKSQCPPLYDPTNPEHLVPLPQTARTLYKMQEHATRACLKLLREGENPFLLGEVGTGKTTVALTTAFAYGAKRIAVVCPPHLTRSWPDQVRSVLSGAVVQIVNNISDFNVEPNTTTTEPGAGMVIYVIAQTAAKLSHAMAPAVLPENRCPKCGSIKSATESEITKERRWCKTRSYIPKDELGQLCLDLASLEYPSGGSASPWLVSSRMLRKMRCEWKDRAPGRLEPLLKRLGEMLFHRNDLWRSFALLAISHPGSQEIDDYLADLANRLYTQEGATSYTWDVARNILLLLQDPERARSIAAEWESRKIEKTLYYLNPWQKFREQLAGSHKDHSDGPRRSLDGGVSFHHNRYSYERGDVAAASKALRILEAETEWARGEPCNTPLYQSSPNPRRYPLAMWLSRYGRHLYDMVLLDEGHEYRTKGSAQEKAAHRICERKPTILLSGSIMSGKASSLFINMWALSRRFRAEFGRDQQSEFITRYGYRKTLVEVPKDKSEKVSVYGTHSDRVEPDYGKVRTLGEAPGVLPLFVLTHLMRQAVWMHKTDLDNELPPAYESRETVLMLGEQAERYEELQNSVVKQAAQDRFDKLLTGRLMGALGQVPSYADLCTSDVGNGHSEAHWIVQYPAHLEVFDPLVAMVPLYPADVLLPKEEWLINKVQSELAEERNVIVFVYHTGGGLAQRLQRILNNAGIPSSYMDAGKVSSRIRESWLDQEIENGCRVLLVNPTAVQTGLNNLVHFCTAIWYEPICDAIIWRQANGRLDRIGQTREVRIIAAVYEACTQVDVLDLNAAKVEVSMMLDGLSTSSALKASGAGDGDTEMAYSLGQALFHRITDPNRTQPVKPAVTQIVRRDSRNGEEKPEAQEQTVITFKRIPAWIAQGKKRKPAHIENEALQYMMF